MPALAARANAEPAIRIAFDGIAYECQPGETVLDALLRQGASVAYSCHKGTCLTCLLRCTAGSVDASAQAGLKDSLVLDGYFLACQSRPTGDLELRSADTAALFVPAEVVSNAPLSSSVRQLLLKPLSPFDYRPGQFINLRGNLRGSGDLLRSYSLASLSVSGVLELHVRRHDNGQMSGWIFDELRAGEKVKIQGPNGASFYVPGRPEQPMLLIATGTGLAPILGVLRDALAHGHSGPIRLYHGSRTRWGIYLDDELRRMAGNHANLMFAPCVSRDEPEGGFRGARADVAAFLDLPSLKGWRVFLAGNPPMVVAAKKSAYLAGATLRDIYADPFELRDLRGRERSDGAPD